MEFTDLHWKVFELCHPDHRRLALDDAAEELDVDVDVVKHVLGEIKDAHPDLFRDIRCGRRRFDNRVRRLRPDDDLLVRRKF